MKMKLLSTAVASMAAMSMAQTLNTGVWFDGSDQQVNTGADCVYEYGTCESTTMGYWYDYDDRLNDHGGSFAEYPFDGGAKTEAPYYGSYIAPMIEEFGYAAIKYHVNDPVAAGQVADYNYSFVGFGFNVKNGDQDPFDISATGGLCVTYTADHNVAMEIAEATSGDDACFITLKKSATPVTVDAAIADFAQPTYTKTNTPERVIDCMQAFQGAKAVKFKLDGGATGGLTGTLRIFSVGPKGTCTTGSIAAEPAAWPCKSEGHDGLANCSGTGAIGASVAASSVKATLAGRTLSFSGINNDASFEVVSLQGQVVKSGVAAGSVSLSNINAGVYMVRVSGKSVNMVQKILVK